MINRQKPVHPFTQALIDQEDWEALPNRAMRRARLKAIKQLSSKWRVAVKEAMDQR